MAKVKVLFAEIVPKEFQKYANWKIGIEIEVEIDNLEEIQLWQAQARYEVLQEKVRVLKTEGEDVDAIIELARQAKPKESGIMNKLLNKVLSVT